MVLMGIKRRADSARKTYKQYTDKHFAQCRFSADILAVEIKTHHFMSHFTYPNFQHHRIDNAANDGYKIEHVPRIFEEILRSFIGDDGEKFDY